MAKFNLPIKGVSSGTVDNEPVPLTSGHINNIRIKDVLEGKIRISKRLVLDKAFSQQIGGATWPVACLIIVTVMD